MNHCASIEPLIYLTEDELSAAELVVLQKHLDSCADCHIIRIGILKNRSSIIDTIHKLTPPSQPKSAENRLLRWVTISSSAAAILFLFLFSIEQARSVSRISRLEKIIVQVPVSDPNRLFDRITLIQSQLTSDEWSTLIKGIFKDPFQLTPTLHPLRPDPDGNFYLVDMVHWKGKTSTIRRGLLYILQNNPGTDLPSLLSPNDLQKYRIHNTFRK